MLSTIYWDPSPNIFTIPFLNHPLKWYGLLFMGGFIAGFLLFLPILRQKLLQSSHFLKKDTINETIFKYVDGLIWWVIIGTVIGARLGHVFFYDWHHYQHHLANIFKVWEGGLASHGGTVGMVLAIYLYSRRHKEKFPELNFLALLDLLSIPAAFGIIFIRLGNFINQEILGTPSSLPWAVVFGHPADGSSPIPRHPVQLYEAIAYFLIFLLLTSLWKFKRKIAPEGLFTGILFTCVFGSRFFLEFFKASLNSSLLDGGFLQAGQILSLPFVAFGVLLIYHSQKRKLYGNADKLSES